MRGTTKHRVCVLTATRAEYGLLKPIILKLREEFDVRVAVTGMHLSPEFGLTYQEIESDGILIDEKIEILLSADTPAAISKTMALALMGFADYFARITPDLLVVLGDRYETLAVCCAAMNERIPIAHMYGGETTEGAIDEAIRHSITKLSYLHFTSTEEYRDRVIQLGESPERVFNVGAMGVENAVTEKLLTKAKLEESLKISLDKPYVVVTFHPITLDGASSADQFQGFLKVCDHHPDLKFIFSKANADAHGRAINQMLDNYVAEHDNAYVFTSLGTVRYLSLLKHSSVVMGNSSSGITEAPSLGVPTVNIGDRQKGRVQADSVINCTPVFSEIENALKLAFSESFKRKVAESVNPYGSGQTSAKIAQILRSFLVGGKIDLKKKFYNIRGNAN